MSGTERNGTEATGTYLLSADSSSVLHALKDKIKAYTGGQLPHAKDILPALYELMETGEGFKEATPLAQPPALSKQATTDGNWEGLKLVTDIRLVPRFQVLCTRFQTASRRAYDSANLFL